MAGLTADTRAEHASNKAQANGTEDDKGEDKPKEEETEQPVPSVAAAEDDLYDPEEDARDEAWVRQQQRGRRSDAILSCPACFTTLCLDCQQHSDPNLHHVFRAMFVTNCRMDASQTVEAGLAGKSLGKRKRGRQRGKPVAPDVVDPEGLLFHPVFCEACDTAVGAVDSEEVVHFYQVLASRTQ